MGAGQPSAISFVFSGSIATDEKFDASVLASSSVKLGPSAHGSSFIAITSNEKEISHGRVPWQALWAHIGIGPLASSIG